MAQDLYAGIEAVVFDFDGTLAETNIDFAKMRSCIYALVQQWGLWEEQMGDNRYVLEVIDAAEAKLEDREQARQFEREAEQVLIDVEMETCAAAVPYPGVEEALATLRTLGLRLGIVTRNCRACVDQFLARHPFPCEVVLTRDDVELVKPNPAHLLAALRILDLPPQAVLMVGDHRSDIECAIAAGCRSAGVYLTGTTAEAFAELGADASYPDVPALVEAMRTDLAGA
jgi:phosphoglycolate phosphatase